MTASRLRENPATPAKAIWAREIWPDHPVRTTSDRQTRAPIMLVTRAIRSWPPRASTATAPPTLPIAAVSATRRGRPANGSRLVPPPRDNRAPAPTASATTITAKGRASRTPDLGIHE